MYIQSTHQNKCAALKHNKRLLKQWLIMYLKINIKFDTTTKHVLKNVLKCVKQWNSFI